MEEAFSFEGRERNFNSFLWLYKQKLGSMKVICEIIILREINDRRRGLLRIINNFL